MEFKKCKLIVIEIWASRIQRLHVHAIAFGYVNTKKCFISTDSYFKVWDKLSKFTFDLRVVIVVSMYIIVNDYADTLFMCSSQRLHRHCFYIVNDNADTMCNVHVVNDYANIVSVLSTTTPSSCSRSLWLYICWHVFSVHVVSDYANIMLNNRRESVMAISFYMNAQWNIWNT